MCGKTDRQTCHKYTHTTHTLTQHTRQEEPSEKLTETDNYVRGAIFFSGVSPSPLSMSVMLVYVSNACCVTEGRGAEKRKIQRDNMHCTPGKQKRGSHAAARSVVASVPFVGTKRGGSRALMPKRLAWSSRPCMPILLLAYAILLLVTHTCAHPRMCVTSRSMEARRMLNLCYTNTFTQVAGCMLNLCYTNLSKFASATAISLTGM